MSSPFLLGGGFNLSVLQDGSTPIFVASAQVNDLAPGLPVRTDASHRLVGGLIQVADCAFTPMSNPATADLDMNGQAVIHVREARLNENVTPTTPPTNGLTVFTHAHKLQYVDDTSAIYQVATATDIAACLPLDGSRTMVGSLNMGGYDISVVNQLSGSVNSRAADDIVSSSGTATAGRVAIFSSNKVIQDGGTLLSSLATTAALASYLPKAGGTMTGDINMGTHNITNVTAIRPVDSNVNIGSSTSQVLGGIGNTMLNDFAATTGNYGLAAGVQATAQNNAIAIGRSTFARDNATVVGYQSTVGPTYTNSVVVGQGNTSSGTSGDIFGVNRTNSTASSLLLGNGSYVNIRANSTCDLGTAAVPFQTAYLGGSVAGPTYTRTADNIVSNAGASVSGNLASLSGTTGKVIADSGVVATSVVVGPASAVAGNLATYSGTTGKLIADSGIAPSTLVVGPGCCG